MDWRRIVGTNIRRLREERSLSQEELGFRAKVDFGYLGKIERGIRNPSLERLGRIAEALGVDLTQLVERRDAINIQGNKDYSP
jgi:transcriptional regulator with XRE-family HTH domain